MSSLTEADVSGNVAESEHKTISVTFDSSDGLAVCEQLVSDDAWLKGFGGRLRNAKRLLVHNVEAIGNWKSPRDRMQLMKLLLSTSVVFSTVARSEIGDLVQTLCLWFEHRGKPSLSER
jgi:hypothetical protein